VNLAETRTVLGCLLAYYPKRELPPETVEAWSAALVDHEVLDGLAAANLLGHTSRFLPSCAELLEACRDARRERFASMPALPAGDDGPAPGAWPFKRWLRERSTPADRRSLAIGGPTLAARYGIRLEQLEQLEPPTDAANGRGGKGDA
jgi:hypothetical protein